MTRLDLVMYEATTFKCNDVGGFKVEHVGWGESRFEIVIEIAGETHRAAFGSSLAFRPVRSYAYL